MAALVLSACGAAHDPVEGAEPPQGAAAPRLVAENDVLTSRSQVPAAAPPSDAQETSRPAWLGTRVLPRRADGFGQVLPTPDELTDRRLPPPPHGLAPPPADGSFASTVETVPADVLARSTWHEDCPVGVDQLRYLTVTFWGFDDRPHTGELLVHRDVADDVVEVFRAAYDARFPIEQMSVVHPDELELPPTGDGNNTTGFVCRATRGSGAWSQHAYGLAVDVNPFHNPYVRDDLVVPELASAYVDRSDLRPGMLTEGGPVVAAFDRIGWGWGGRWRSLSDDMHFSANGR